MVICFLGLQYSKTLWRIRENFISLPGSIGKSLIYFSSFLVNACSENGSLYFITLSIFFCCSQKKSKCLSQSFWLWETFPSNEKAWGISSLFMIYRSISIFTVYQHMLELNKLIDKQIDGETKTFVLTPMLYLLFNIKRQGVVKPPEFSFK